MAKESTDKDLTSRREFIKRSGLALAGTTLGTMVFSSACSGAKTTTTAGDTSLPAETTSTTVPPVSASTTPTNASSTSQAPSSSTAPTSSTASFYVAPTTKPVMSTVPGCVSVVAMDRLYSKDNMWVKTLGTDKAVIGITDALSLEIVPTDVVLPKVGQTFKPEDTMGTMEGQKISTDIFCPVSGTVWQINTYLPELTNPEGIQILVDDPYGAAWMMVITLSKPDELKTLLTPQQYIALSAKT
jgi:glycine cleavage system H protein